MSAKVRMPSKVEWANLERVMEMVYKTRFLGAKHKIGRHQEYCSVNAINVN